MIILHYQAVFNSNNESRRFAQSPVAISWIPLHEAKAKLLMHAGMYLPTEIILYNYIMNEDNCAYMHTYILLCYYFKYIYSL